MKKLIDIPILDRPREKLVKKGVTALSSHELLMVILGRGMEGRDVAAQATDILKLIETEKEGITLEKLEQIQGIGVAKAGQILAAFELAKRYLIKEDKKIRNTDDILALVADLRDKKQELFITITLTGASSLINKREVFKGTINFSVVHPREIFADALADRAAGIIFVHNHPADDAQPSEADIKLTKRLCEVAKLMGIQVVDHIIITKDSYYSFQADGLLDPNEYESN
ncbi:MAG: DNA repair protein RadC [Euryarchaeota archaeon]|nr:DNA repair protein RadC [Euryarchaeota archaeon]MCG2736179.1 DNA repair protein RadC [Candidatus Methanoperedenaceae archaeon]MDP3104536.1 DNA repair protein RadC [Candidatus Methanoperedens sp.]